MSPDLNNPPVPLRDAATVLILDERPDLQVLMLKRNAHSVFVPDMWLYPGGAVDPDDGSEEADQRVENRTNADASERLGLEMGGIAYWVAALRETFEEAGVLLARRRGESELLDLSDPEIEKRFSVYRSRLNDREDDLDFLSVIRDEDLLLDGSGVHYISRWITPEGAPRRYDTRFFVTAMPKGQTPLHDNEEAVHHEWMRAADAIAKNETDEMLMLAPTMSVLKVLTSFDTVADALEAAAAATAADEQTLRIDLNDESHNRILFPGDPGYADANEDIERGWVRW